MESQLLDIGIVGATGAVGTEFLKVLERRKFPVGKLRLFASARSRGKKVIWKQGEYEVEILQSGCFAGLDCVFFDASDPVSKEWAPQALESKAWVIDNSAAFRLSEGTPLVVPEVNGALLDQIRNGPPRLIAGANCTTIPMVMVLSGLRPLGTLEHVWVATYQSVSGAGQAGVTELLEQTGATLAKAPHPPQVFSHPIAFNVIPQIGRLDDNGYTSEELKLIRETQKILAMPKLAVSSTAVRVPTVRGHAEVVSVRFDRDVAVSHAEKLLGETEGVEYWKADSKTARLPTPALQASTDQVYVSRLRSDLFDKKALSFWVLGDNLLKGAALNAVNIAERLFL